VSVTRGAPTIRVAGQDDAELFATFMKAIRAERLTGLDLRHEEFTPDSAMGIFGDHWAAFSVLLFAERFGELVGVLDMVPRHRPGYAHSAFFQILIGRPHRHTGVGTALLTDLIYRIESARQIRRLEAEVLETNTPFLTLCGRSGFVVEGRKRDAVLVDGAYVDSVMLARLWPSHFPAEDEGKEEEQE